jgi:heterodisulfide reductase subunit B
MEEKYALFTGCFIQTELPYLEKASVEILKSMEIKPIYLEFSCCPNPRVRSVDENSWLNIAGRNLAIAEREGLDVITLCSDCYGTLKMAEYLLKNESKREGVNESLKEIDLAYNGEVGINHIMDLIFANREKIVEKIKFPINLSLAVHDGCRIQRPSEVVKYKPGDMDDLLRLIGCEIIPYHPRDLCCGSPAATVNQAISDEIARLKLNEINEIQADGICTGCPLCFMQYDRIQNSNIPIFYYPELLAIAMGIHPKEIGIQYHQTNAEGAIEKCLRS